MTSTLSIAIALCPHCGHEPAEQRNEYGDEYTVRVVCKRCGFGAPNCYGMESAVKTWNAIVQRERKTA